MPDPNMSTSLVTIQRYMETGGNLMGHTVIPGSVTMVRQGRC